MTSCFCSVCKIFNFFLAFGPFITDFFFQNWNSKTILLGKNIEICKLLMKIISSLIQQANGSIFLNLQDLIKKK